MSESIPLRPLIAPIESMLELRAEYEGGSQEFVQQIDWLVANGWKGVRRARGDGDCFYRSLAFAYVERILQNPEPVMGVTSAISLLEVSQPMLEAAGFEPVVFEDFYEVFVSIINRIIIPGPDGELLTPITLLEAFNNDEVSNSIVAYLRLLTSAQIREDPESYAAFLFHPESGESMDVRSFCENFVESVGKEADHVQITALSRVMKVNIDVAYLDGHTAEKVDFVHFHNTDYSGLEPIILLYRPGHYDILDQREYEEL
ncbi:cysteine proteinase [Sparassis latifolia]